jgi:hypothetical protein
VPYTLGSGPRFVAERLWPRQSATVAYTVRTGSRGRYRIGPLAVRLTDMFGLCEVTTSFSTSSELIVTPSVQTLPPVRIAGEWAGGGQSRSRALAVHGEDDAIPREYRHGDDLRKVHWRATARAGELMVRREEQPRQSRAVVLLDTRASAHRGESLEWAISAAASLTLHLAHAGYALRLLTDTGPAPADGGARLDGGAPFDGGARFDGALLGHLADIRASRSHRGLAGIAGQLRRPGGEGLVVAVLGALDARDIGQLGAVRAGGNTCVAVLLDVGSWGGVPAPFSGGAEGLTRAGWHVLPARLGTDLAQIWPTAASRATAAGSR